MPGLLSLRADIDFTKWHVFFGDERLYTTHHHLLRSQLHIGSFRRITTNQLGERSMSRSSVRYDWLQQRPAEGDIELGEVWV